MAQSHFHLLRELAAAEEDAGQVFRGAIEHAVGEIGMRWADPLSDSDAAAPGRASHWPAFEHCYPTHRRGEAPAPGWGPARFEWSFGINELRRERPGEVAFAAGVVARLDAEASPLDGGDWVAERRAEGFTELRNPRLCVAQLVRWLYPEELLAVGAPGEQGEHLADWVISTFESLAGRPPPVSGA